MAAEIVESLTTTDERRRRVPAGEETVRKSGSLSRAPNSARPQARSRKRPRAAAYPGSASAKNSLVQLGYGKHRRLIQAAMTERTSAVAVDIASDKELTKMLLRDAGIEVPRGILAQSEAEAIEALEIVGAPVVVKPYNMSQGKGVSLNLTDGGAGRAGVPHREAVCDEGRGRAPVRGARLSRAGDQTEKWRRRANASPPTSSATASARSRSWWRTVNRHPARGEDHERPLTKIVIDAAMIEFMKRRRSDRGPCAEGQGQVVYLRECANLSTGGTATDVTDLIHPQVAAMCERAARIIGLDVCGIDLILDDIAESSGP